MAKRHQPVYQRPLMVTAGTYREKVERGVGTSCSCQATHPVRQELVNVPAHGAKAKHHVHIAKSVLVSETQILYILLVLIREELDAV